MNIQELRAMVEPLEAEMDQNELREITKSLLNVHFDVTMATLRRLHQFELDKQDVRPSIAGVVEMNIHAARFASMKGVEAVLDVITRYRAIVAAKIVPTEGEAIH